MFNYKYCVDFFIKHPSLPAEEIVPELSTFKLTRKISKGHEYKDSSGNTIRTAPQSYVSGRIHHAEYEQSSAQDIDGILSRFLTEFEMLSEFIRKLRDTGGSCGLRVGVFPVHKHCVVEFDHRMGGVLERTGCPLQIHFYSAET